MRSQLSGLRPTGLRLSLFPVEMAGWTTVRRAVKATDNPTWTLPQRTIIISCLIKLSEGEAEMRRFLGTRPTHDMDDSYKSAILRI